MHLPARLTQCHPILYLGQQRVDLAFAGPGLGSPVSHRKSSRNAILCKLVQILSPFKALEQLRANLSNLEPGITGGFKSEARHRLFTK
jgi:hypothetical protein